MKSIVLISLLVLISSKDNTIDFAKEIPFDKNNSKFEFTYDKNDSFFIQVTCNDTTNFRLKTNGGNFGFMANPPGNSLVSYKILSDSYTINIESESNSKGTFWINPSLLDVKIDLNSKIEWKYYTSSNNENAKLTYAIENAEKDVTFIFKYSYPNVDEKDTLSNPFEVCHKDECKEDISTYDFKKGESYKINVKHIKISSVSSNYTGFPCFSFYDKSKDKKSNSINLVYNIWTICLLLFIL